MPKLADIQREILAGLRNESTRLDQAKKNRCFYRGDFEQYPPRLPESNDYDSKHRYIRWSRIMTRVVDVLTQNLYKQSPARTFPDHPDEVADWLEAVYKQNAMEAQWQEADRLATVNQVAAWQVTPTEDPERPLEIYLWDGASFVVWTEDFDPTLPAAIATIDVYDNMRRLVLWTAEVKITYETEKIGVGQTSGGTAWKQVASEPNPFGILPFSFVHFRYPTCDFWSGGPGDVLTEANDWLNSTLTALSDSVRYNLRPVITAHGVRAGWNPPRPIRPGDIWDIPAEGMDATGVGPEPRVEYLQADPSFLPASWEDAQNYIDHLLEMQGVPPVAVRMTQTDAQSGVAIVAEQIPLILWAQSRQRDFSFYEEDLAKLVLSIGAMHLGYNNVTGATTLAAAALNPGLVLKWPNLFPELPGPDRDTADQFELELGLTSRILLVMKRYNMTREEAEAYLEQVVEDRKWEQEQFGELMPAMDGRDPKAIQDQSGQQMDQQQQPQGNGQPQNQKQNGEPQ